SSTTRDGKLAPLLENLGELRRSVTTSSAMPQRFFDQGLTLTYGFNHAEAVRSFKEAAREDPTCAMAYWGQALATGPNINDPAPGAEREQEAFRAIQKALDLNSGASEVEQAMIGALATRFSAVEVQDRTELNGAYAKAMADLHQKYPDDPDIGVLYAASIMNTMPWEYWGADGEANPGTDTVVKTLEAVIAAAPNHPGAHHYYIHAVEASNDPDRAVGSADRLGGLVPGAGHLVHMPAHIYIRVGRYADSSAANLRAIAADEDYLTQCRSQGIYPAAYYPHNIHFLSASLAMEGRSREAIEAARKVASHHDDEMMKQPGFGFPHLLRAYHLFALVRFGRWEEVLELPEPAEKLLFGRAMRHYGRGLAFVAADRLDDAQAELAKLKTLAGRRELEDLKVWDMNSLAALARISAGVLAGELAAKSERYNEAITHLRKAVAEEDGLLYAEPPDWPNPVRQNLGAVLLAAGRAGEAERVYREDLTRHRDNGWSLHGLAQSLEAQGKGSEASEARKAFSRAWARADIEL
ncbi:MAG: hypothetical protein GY953_06575, partial [bacterium]|nr:hypothetical protein [bacterium]